MILWDGRNNDFLFYKSVLHVTVLEPHRTGHEITYYPGNVTLRLSDVVAINKMCSADSEGIESARRNIAFEAPDAIVIDAASTLDVDDISVIGIKRWWWKTDRL